MASAEATAAFARAMGALGDIEAPPERELTTEQVSELAMERAGTRDKKSRAYKSARRSIERRRTTTAKETRGQRVRRLTDAIRRRGLHVQAEVEMDPSPDPDSPEEDKRPRSIDIYLGGEVLDPLATALDRGDVDEAAAEFWDAVLRGYEEVGPDEHSFLAGAADDLDVSALSIELG